MLNWTDKIDNVDDVLATDINSIAHAVIDLETTVGDANELLEDAMGGV